MTAKDFFDNNKISTFKKGDKIEITVCTALGRTFSNLVPGSIHEIVKPPQGYVNDQNGVWVMGIGKKVRVFSNEFKKVKEHDSKRIF